MKTMHKFGVALGVVGVLTLGGCATTNDPFNTSGSVNSSSQETTYPGTSNSGNAYSGYGVVQSIDLVQQGNAGNTGIGGSGIGIGTIAGAVIGGVLGNQVGGGTGQTVATVAGAAGGAYVGHEIDKRQQKPTEDVYRFNVRMENGSYQAFTQNTNTGFRVGDRVRIDNGAMQRY
jgi:outer membrane lipoprotein SlyB